MENISAAKKGSKIETLIAMNALYRPGPEKFIPDFIEGRKNAASIKYTCPELEPILAPTFGVIVYQEQVMQIVRDLAGYTWGRSDLVRRAMSKKHQDEIDAERHTFVYGNVDTKKPDEKLVPGCIANGISETAAHKIWDDMTDFAKYAFNKSHATAYSVTSYWTAYLKYYYPAYYIANVMNYADKIEDIADDIDDAKDFGVKVLPPDINKSSEKCDVVDGNIIYGLSNIKNVGSSAEGIIADREANGPYSDIVEFLERVSIDTSALASLIKAGAFDSLGYTRSQISLDMVSMSEILADIKKIREKQKFITRAKQVSEFVDEYLDIDSLKERIAEEGISYSITSKKVPTKDSIIKRINSTKTAIEELEDDLHEIEIEYVEDDQAQILEDEKEVLGIYISGHPTDGYNILTDPISDATPETTAVSGVIKNLTIRKNKVGQDWATFEVEDKTGSINAVCFANYYAKNRTDLVEGAKLCLTGIIKEDSYRSTDDETIYQIVVAETKPLRKNRSAYRFVASISEVNDILNEIDSHLTNSENEGDLLYWLDSITGIEHKINRFLTEPVPGITQKCS